MFVLLEKLHTISTYSQLKLKLSSNLSSSQFCQIVPGRGFDGVTVLHVFDVLVGGSVEVVAGVSAVTARVTFTVRIILGGWLLLLTLRILSPLIRKQQQLLCCCCCCIVARLLICYSVSFYVSVNWVGIRTGSFGTMVSKGRVKDLKKRMQFVRKTIARMVS